MLIHIYSNHASALSKKKAARTWLIVPCAATQKISANENRSRPTRKCRLTQCGRTGHQLPHPTMDLQSQRTSTNRLNLDFWTNQPAREGNRGSTERPDIRLDPRPRSPIRMSRSMASCVHGRRRFAMAAKRGASVLI